MSRQVTTTVYQYGELSDEAKARAREWLRSQEDQDWSSRARDYYENMATCLAFLGIEVGKRTESWQCLDGRQLKRQVWGFEWTGFNSPGDGLVLRGSWAAERVDLAGLQEHAPQDVFLHTNCQQMAALMLRHPTAHADINTSSSGASMPYITIDNDGVDPDGEIPLPIEDRQTLRRLIKDACLWAYRQLEMNYESDMSDESIENMITANEYEFTEEGERS